ncbi:major facilitator superfamily MFS_1 [Candidatus Vecturithrix granuli]|uniref:Major facilitator superfamily MFS_1 n=1 Tax=Vecturithrix granuli TaxID=1499967 RepID=A0A081C8N1_VECG1|nr:major facilitator superfamily MFS_1 [Candidatus Vecturithrix granuli]
MYTVLPTHTAEAGITLALVGILLGVNRAVRLVFNGVAGWCYDRITQRGLFLGGLALGAFSTACCAAAYQFWLLFVGRTLWGVAWSLIWIGGGVILLNLAESAERGRWTGWYQTWFFFGAGSGAFLGGMLTDLMGYHPTLWIITAIQACSVVVVAMFLPSIPDRMPAIRKEQPSQSLKTFFTHDFGLTVFLQGINRFCIPGMLAATLGLLVKERLVSPQFVLGAGTITGLLIAGRTVLSMAIAPLSGYLSDRLKSRWSVLSFALIIGIAAMLFLTSHIVLLIVIGFLCSAVITSSVQSLTITLTGDLVADAHRGKAVSILHTVGDLGSALGPPCAYTLLLYTGLSEVYLVCAFLFAVPLGLIVLKIRRNK